MASKIDPKMGSLKDMELLKDSKGISWVLSNLESVPKNFFKKYVENKYFLDIGSGDGRVVFLAMKCGAKKYHGIEIEEKFIQKSIFKRFIKKCDYRKIDLNRYDVLYYFLGSMEEIPPKNEGEPEFVNYVKNFEGILIIYYQEVPHRLEMFQENLIKEGFKEIDNSEFLRVYERKK